MQETNTDIYQVSVGDFNGPLDLLLELVKQAKINIADIFLSRVTDKFLSLMSALADIDVDRATEFLAVAAILLEIKSKALLPQEQLDIDDSVELKKEFIHRLEEYKLLKDASEKLKESEIVGAYTREYIPIGDYKEVLKENDSQYLSKALQDMFLKLEKKPFRKTKAINLDPYTVEDKIKYIKGILLNQYKCVFDDLFDQAKNKLEVITTFQALLELIKLQQVSVVQLDNYSIIEIYRV